MLIIQFLELALHQKLFYLHLFLRSPPRYFSLRIFTGSDWVFVFCILFHQGGFHWIGSGWVTDSGSHSEASITTTSCYFVSTFRLCHMNQQLANLNKWTVKILYLFFTRQVVQGNQKASSTLRLVIFYTPWWHTRFDSIHTYHFFSQIFLGGTTNMLSIHYGAWQKPGILIKYMRGS